MAARRTKPGGSKPDKVWTDALRLAVHELRADPANGKKLKALRLIARAIVDAALKGDMTAIKEIGDRLDGKARQVIGGDDQHPAKLVVEIIDPTK